MTHHLQYRVYTYSIKSLIPANIVQNIHWLSKYIIRNKYINHMSFTDDTFSSLIKARELFSNELPLKILGSESCLFLIFKWLSLHGWTWWFYFRNYIWNYLYLCIVIWFKPPCTLHSFLSRQCTRRHMVQPLHIVPTLPIEWYIYTSMPFLEDHISLSLWRQLFSFFL